jgi:hypothetical protein
VATDGTDSDKLNDALTILNKAVADFLDVRESLADGWMPAEFLVLGVARRWNEDGTSGTKYYWIPSDLGQPDYVSMGIYETVGHFLWQRIDEEAED